MELCTKSRGDIFLQDVNGGINYTRTLLTPLYVKDRELFYKLVGRNSIAPMDNYLGVDKLPFHITYTMMARCATEAMKAKSFVCASNSLKEAGYQHISASMVDQVCETVGQALWDYYKERADIMQSRLARGEKIGPVNVDIHNIHSLNPEKVLILMIDGHTIYTRKYSTGKYDINDGGKCGCDCRVGIAFRLSDCSVEYDEAGGETVRISHKDYTSLIVPKNEFRNYFADLAIRNGADQCELIVVVSDGADWLHKMVVELFDSYVHIRDLWHAKECIAEFCKALFQDNPEKGILFSNYLCHLIEEGNIDKFLKELEPYKDIVINVNGNKLVNPYKYVDSRKDGMEYNLYKRLGLPVGSGAIESSNKIYHRRMRTIGSLWTKIKANRMVMIISNYETGGEKLILKIILAMKESLRDIASRISKEGLHRTYNKKPKLAK